MEYLLGFGLIPIVLVISVIWGLRATWGALALIEFLLALLQAAFYLRTKNPAFLWMMAAFLLIVAFGLQVSVFGLTKKDPLFILFALGVIFAIPIMGYQLLNKKLKWRTREILELAAMPVNETKNGFTERPLPSGEVNATKAELAAFSEFIAKNLIAIPYIENGKIIFSLTSSYWKQMGLKRGYSDESWISFGDAGKVTTFISKSDYLKYRDVFSFDQLCINLGHLFIDFFELYKQGDGIRIIDRLNSLKLNPLTE